ncbi:hypothetical protein KBX37_25240 [Micromonospora sp. U56]|uniref:hypothetical protein n=1 Tax=Micromonospora sp. U56 TaxID=2824900 RepID=UPI001B3859AA|nr:hypothetical protein [Micromonospora sp. U56]MBQ0896356.1 hypothetical protein [Micromonospora sp. U56]
MTEGLADLATALALGSGAVVLLTVRSWRTALRVLLDLLVAAGLLRLAVGSGWTGLATAAAIILLRQLLWAGIAAGPPARAPTIAAALRVRRSRPTVSGRTQKRT